MSSLLKEVQKELKASGDEAVKASIKKFVPHSQQVYGVKNPLLNEMAKRFKEGGFELAAALWDSGAFEERLLAAKLLRGICKKDPMRSLKLVKQFSKGISDWATCDTLGMQSLKPLMKNFSEEIFTLAESLNHSSNFWQRRLSLVLVEYFTRDKKYHPRIQKLIHSLENDEEYYVKKAVVWIKRNFEKGR
ncbi:MAG TPA: DNA alkylation repair protein [Chitinophagales bacterium]|nr:DNA alkylation repair protein [Chitinophagales bacterium]